MAQNLVLYTGEYDNVTAALADDAVEQLHKDEMIGSYDAAVIDNESGKPRIVKRMDLPRMRIIPEVFGGTCPARISRMRPRSYRQPGRADRGRRADDRASVRQSGHGRREGREARSGRHDRRDRQRAAGSPQELTEHAATAGGPVTMGRPPFEAAARPSRG